MFACANLKKSAPKLGYCFYNAFLVHKSSAKMTRFYCRRLVKCWQRSRLSGRSVVPDVSLDVSRSYTGADFSQHVLSSRRRGRPIRIGQKNRSILQSQRSNFCLRPCKVLSLNRTKMFHVKHSCKVQTGACGPRHVG